MTISQKEFLLKEFIFQKSEETNTFGCFSCYFFFSSSPSNCSTSILFCSAKLIALGSSETVESQAGTSINSSYLVASLYDKAKSYDNLMMHLSHNQSSTLSWHVTWSYTMLYSISCIWVFSHYTYTSSWQRNNESSIAETIKLTSKRKTAIWNQS